MSQMRQKNPVVISLAKIVLVVTLFALTATAWFPPGGSAYFGFRVVNNTYEACTDDTFQVNYDLGDDSAAIVAKYGKGVNPTNSFRCQYPVALQVWLTASDTSGVYGAYDTARLEYFQGEEATSNDTWTLICDLSVAEMKVANGRRFKIVDWYPPQTNNVVYLLRLYATTVGGTNPPLCSSDLETTNNIGAKGDGYTWPDWAVLKILVIPKKRIGF